MMHRARREQLPPLPTTVADIDLGPYGTTIRGDPFILYHDDKILCLATTDNLQVLSASETVFIDGAFKAAPRVLFTQLFCLHCFHEGHFVTVVYCFLPSKSREMYHHLFEVLKRKMAENDLIFNPYEIMFDFESGLIPAVK